MTPSAIAALCELLSEPSRWTAASSQIREGCGAQTLGFRPTEQSPSAPTNQEMTHWSRALTWAGRTVGVIEGEGAFDEGVLAQVSPLVAWALAQHRERTYLETRNDEVQARAMRALTLSEVVTWLLHARDEAEVERLSAEATRSVLHVDAGALLTRDRAGTWTLRLPAKGLSAELEFSAEEEAVLRDGSQPEREGLLGPDQGVIERTLWRWGFRHAFWTPLIGETHSPGLLIALSMEPRTIDAETWVTAAQLAVMVSMALERLHDQRGLAEHRGALEAALQAASMGTWELELQSFEMTWSKELHQLMGGPCTELRQSHAASGRGMARDDQELYFEKISQLLRAGTTSPFQSEVTCLDGRQAWFRTLFVLVLDAAGNPARVRGVTRDVSVEVRSELDREGALERASKYERLFALSDTLAAVCTGDGLIEEASPSWTRHLLYEPGELLGVNILSLVHPEDLAEMGRRFIDGPSARAVSRVKAKSGQWRWLSWTATRDGGRYYAAASDVTPLEETSARLRVSENQLRQAGQLARVGAWDFEVATQKLTWSEEVKRMHDVPADFVPAPGMLSRFLSPEATEQVITHMRACIATGAPFELEVEVRSATGRLFWVRHQGQAERVEGKTVRLFCAMQDITEQRRSREEALAASRIKSQFLANTSHEIRTPLNGILGMTQLVLATNVSAEQREYLEAVRTSGQNLLAIVNDVLDISKIEAGHLTLERLPFSVQQAIFEAVRHQVSRAHARGLELTVDLDPALPEEFLGDPVRVGQIVTNLVGNAVKFTERGVVCVAATLDGPALHLEVRDSGIGIPPERIASIFEAFTQADGSTNRRFGGTGLGLTITLELVKAMGGRIEVESTPEVGSRFHVWLPLARSAQVSRPTPPPNGQRVLVVSGHETSGQVVERQLRHLGYDVLSAPASLAVRALLEADAPVHCVVLDQELEHTSGVELAEALEQHADFSHLHRVLLTRTTSRPTQEEVTASGIRRVLTRPVSLADLRDALRPGLDRSAPAATPRTPRRALKVLLAEDNAINARLAQRLLERLGHSVTHVGDGALAVEAVVRESWDAVLMDMQMPVLDGLEATRRIRLAERARGGHLPIIALTANAMKGDDQVCFEAGMDGYLTKPIDLDRLGEALERLARPRLREMSA